VGGLSVVGQLLEHNDVTHGGSEEQEKMIKEVAAAAYAGRYIYI
jgi:hypothetical protein